MAVKQRVRHQQHIGTNPGRRAVEMGPNPREQNHRPRISISLKQSIAILLFLAVIVTGCIWKYNDNRQQELEHSYKLKQQDMEYQFKRETQAAELKHKEALASEERTRAHEEEMQRIKTVSAREVELEKYKLDLQKEKELHAMTLETQIQIELQQQQIDKELKEIELKNQQELEKERLILLAEKQLEYDAQMQMLAIEQKLEEEKIQATKDIYLRSFEAKKVVKKKSYLFGLYSTEEEDVESPLKDGETLRMVQEALRPQLTQRHSGHNAKSEPIDEEL